MSEFILAKEKRKNYKKLFLLLVHVVKLQQQSSYMIF